MLQYLHVKNLALIDEAEVDFGEGLNVLTGETGAGKSIIIGSISLALGEKVPKELLREGEDSLVELVFSTDEETAARLRELEIVPEEGTVILTRKIVNGRVSARINSETVTAARLKEAAALLIDIHGQHEHQSLLKESKHLTILDKYLGADFEQKKAGYGDTYRRWHEISRELKEASVEDSERNRELSLLDYEIAEIRNAALRTGEDAELEGEFRRLSNGKKIGEAVAAAAALLSEGEPNASAAVGRACRELAAVAGYDPKLDELHTQITELDNLLSDAAHAVNSYLADTVFDEETFRATQDRLSEINRLKDKYGGTTEQVLEALKEREERSDFLLHAAERRETLKEELAEAEKELSERAAALTELRKAGAKKLCEEIRASLLDLNFLDVRFTMEFPERTEYTPDGVDAPRFLIAVNPGEMLQPLSKVASGGELSRIMLSLKTVLAEEDRIGTLIFDEIDAGISGRTAQAVSEKLHLLGKRRQVICITHLPQIAAMADMHFLIEKNVTEGTTISTIRNLNDEESIEELARLLGGAKLTDAVRENAREMKMLARDGGR